MVINRYISDLMASNMYIIVEDDHAIVIDPYRNTEMGEGLIIDKIILTHEHYDHISGVNEWKDYSGAQVLCSERCARNLKDTRKNLARHFKEFSELQTWMQIDKMPSFDKEYTCEADHTFVNEYSFFWREHKFCLFEMPGHSQGSIGILVDNTYFFSGDSLLEGVELDFRMPGGSRKDWENLGKKRLESIPKGVLVFPGHLNEFNLSTYVNDLS